MAAVRGTSTKSEANLVDLVANMCFVVFAFRSFLYSCNKRVEVNKSIRNESGIQS